MGEITEALRRAKVEHERRTKVQAAAEAAMREAEVLETAAPALRERAYPNPPAPVSWKEPEKTAGISKAQDATWRARTVVVNPHGAAAERFRQFALRLRRRSDPKLPRCVLVTSALRQEGKTTVACNLALAMASLAAGRGVALVDLDLRRPSVSPGLGIAPRVGIERVLRGEAPLESARLATDVPHFDVFMAGRPSQTAHELLAGARLTAILAELDRHYDFVILDSPPVLLVPDALLLAPHVGSIVLVVRAGQSRRDAFKEMLACLPAERLAGVFLNDTAAARHAHQYGYYFDRPDEEARSAADG